MGQIQSGFMAHRMQFGLLVYLEVAAVKGNDRVAGVCSGVQRQRTDQGVHTDYQ